MATVDVALLFWQTLLKFTTAKEIITVAENKRRLTNRLCTKELLRFPVFLIAHWPGQAHHLQHNSNVQRHLRWSERKVLFLGIFTKENSPEKQQLFSHLIDSCCCLHYSEHPAETKSLQQLDYPFI